MMDWEPVHNSIAAGPNCGIGAGGFQPGNKCALGGGSKQPAAKARITKRGEVMTPATRDAVTKKWMVNGEEAPEHIQTLGIVPSWKDVRVNMDPKGTLLAEGKDAKGRTQSKFSATHDAKAAAAKFGRTRELIKKRVGIFKELERDAKKPDLKENAECLKVIMQTGIRPGSNADTGAEYESFGATTIQGRHVRTNSDGSVSLVFVPGKHKGKEVEFPIRDPETAKMLQLRAAANGADKPLFNTDAGSLRKYSKTKDGGGFKTKDHRTALGTETAIAEISSRTTAPTNKKEYKAAVKEVAIKVSQLLGNTPTVALKSYIDPTVFLKWKQGAGV